MTKYIVLHFWKPFFSEVHVAVTNEDQVPALSERMAISVSCILQRKTWGYKRHMKPYNYSGSCKRDPYMFVRIVPM